MPHTSWRSDFQPNHFPTSAVRDRFFTISTKCSYPIANLRLHEVWSHLVAPRILTSINSHTLKYSALKTPTVRFPERALADKRQSGEVHPHRKGNQHTASSTLFVVYLAPSRRTTDSSLLDSPEWFLHAVCLLMVVDENDKGTYGPVVVQIGVPPDTSTPAALRDATPDILRILEDAQVIDTVVRGMWGCGKVVKSQGILIQQYKSLDNVEVTDAAFCTFAPVI
ncbi:hypothetical protein CVT24_005847 [Panaeolus cyanescens]|uniref:Uncharacterized protein n=1 Tax=Panaeolus cyanescens TaxID=181874 RepID=A0A409YF43_9AGAR|nr:hypothetical protein CVT24_005847 [Panaeolus cyanescens]